MPKAFSTAQRKGSSIGMGTRVRAVCLSLWVPIVLPVVW